MNKALTLLLLLGLAGCTLLSPYDPTSYRMATDLKAESLTLLEKATEPPAPHAAAMADLELKLRKALEYEAGKGDLNSETVGQWRILADPKGDLLGGVIRSWRGGGAGLGRMFVDEKIQQVAEGFDLIIRLENGKVKK